MLSSKMCCTGRKDSSYVPVLVKLKESVLIQHIKVHSYAYNGVLMLETKGQSKQ